jgi:hypothetical protein
MLAGRRAGRRRHRCHPRRQLQPVGGAVLAGQRAHAGRTADVRRDNRLEREEALQLWTHGSAWFSTEQGARAGWRRASSPIARCCRPTTSRWPRTTSLTSPAC